MRSYEVELELNKNKNQISKYHSGANLNEFYITDERKTNGCAFERFFEIFGELHS